MEQGTVQNHAAGRVAATAIEAETFELGLSLSGAISAGAYTAGVLDFLFQALDRWEHHRDSADTPSHRVVIKVIAGASAGAITGALGAVALARGLHEVAMTADERADCYPATTAQDQPHRCVLPALWRTWVELPDMLPSSGENSGLLGVGDLAMGTAVASVLDATVLKRIKTEAIEAPGVAGQRQIRSSVPYVAGPLHVFMTLSNMRGIPYQVEFGHPENRYGMMTHGDRVHYVIADLGVSSLPKHNGDGPLSWLEDDAKGAALHLSVNSLPTEPGVKNEDWDQYGTAALASAAFPIGLAAQALKYPLGHYTERRLPIDLAQQVVVRPAFDPSAGPGPDFAFQTIDGGVVNNSPFDYAQYALFGRGARACDRTDGRRAIIMVAPFPEPPKLPPDGRPAGTLTAILAALFPALINQARFRTSELAPAIDTRDYSRFLVAPKRRIPLAAPSPPGVEPPGRERFAIASGLLGGFGGFLGKAFRAHDFQLGRRNCQQFLRTTLEPPRLSRRLFGLAQAARARVPVWE